MDISILGCGWMGLPLGRALVAAGHAVRGSTTSPGKLDTLAEAGITPHRLVLDPDLEGDAEGFFACDLLFLNIPPTRGRDDLWDHHLAQIDAVLAAARAQGTGYVVMASSTGVYPDVEATLVEADVPPGTSDDDLPAMTSADGTSLDGPRRATGRVLCEAEARVLAATGGAATVLRFGGLYGPERHPARFLAGRSGIAKPEAPVNLIHLDDCVGLAETVIAKTTLGTTEEADAVRGEAFNAVADAHPSRKALYTRAARALGLEPPGFDAADARSGKALSNAKARETLGYRFRHPNPLADAR